MSPLQKSGDSHNQKLPVDREVQKIDLDRDIDITAFDQTKLWSVSHVVQPSETFTSSDEETEFVFVVADDRL